MFFPGMYWKERLRNDDEITLALHATRNKCATGLIPLFSYLIPDGHSKTAAAKS